MNLNAQQIAQLDKALWILVRLLKRPNSKMHRDALVALQSYEGECSLHTLRDVAREMLREIRVSVKVIDETAC